MEYNILIGGQAGQGIKTISSVLSKLLKRRGYSVYSYTDYMSRVRGGHNFCRIRFSNEEVESISNELDVIVALDLQTIEKHIKDLKPKGIVICDKKLEYEDERVMSLDIVEEAIKAGSMITSTTVSVGIIAKLFNLKEEVVKDTVLEHWKENIKEINKKAFKAGYEMVESKFKYIEPKEDDKLLMNGNQAIAMGAISAGMSVYTGYPMAPSTGVMTYLAAKEKEANIVVEQVEDEIAAINASIGASSTGVRAMTGSSGGGLALMAEGIGFAGIGEVPVVIVDVQRPGPATGLPTRTEQSDLSFVLDISQGEMPKIIMSVTDVEDCFYRTFKAFNLAEKYQVPVIILSDEYLADSYKTINKFDFKNLKIERNITKDENYKRHSLEVQDYKFLIPGSTSRVVMTDSHEHDEDGHVSEDKYMRTQMMERRMKKLEKIEKDLEEPTFYGNEKAKYVLIGWGSMKGSVKEAVKMLEKENKSVGALIFSDIFPLPKLKLNNLKDKKFVNVEMNYTGQLAKLIRQETGIDMYKSILKYDGRQMTATEIYSEVKEMI